MAKSDLPRIPNGPPYSTTTSVTSLEDEGNIKRWLTETLKCVTLLIHPIYSHHSRLTSPKDDTTPRVILWCALRLHTVIQHSNCNLGDIVWAHEEAQQLFQGLAEVVVRASFVACELTQYRRFLFS